MKIGYIRSSKKEDTFYKEQKNILQECERVFEDFEDGIEGLGHMLDYMRAEDKVHMYQLDRFGLNIRDVIMLIHDLLEKGIHIMSIHDNIDTSTHEGRILLKIFNVLNMCEQTSVSLTNGLSQAQESMMPMTMSATGSLGQLTSVPGVSVMNSSSHKSNISPISNTRDLLRNAGRPKGLTPQAKEKAETAANMYKDGALSMRDIAQNLNISTATLYSYLRHEKVI